MKNPKSNPKSLKKRSRQDSCKTNPHYLSKLANLTSVPAAEVEKFKNLQQRNQWNKPAWFSRPLFAIPIIQQIPIHPISSHWHSTYIQYADNFCFLYAPVATGGAPPTCSSIQRRLFGLVNRRPKQYLIHSSMTCLPGPMKEMCRGPSYFQDEHDDIISVLPSRDLIYFSWMQLPG